MPNMIITGAAHGIGAETARLAKQAGWTVTAMDISKPEAHIDHFISVDLMDMTSVDEAFRQAAQHGPFDALCNIAGVPPKPDAVAPPLVINFIALRQLTNGLLDHLNKGASIVNLASRAGAAWRRNIAQVQALINLPNDADFEVFCSENDLDGVRAYDLSKEAVIAWTIMECEAMIARDHRMNSISPAPVSTRILEDFVNAYGERVSGAIPRAGRPALPEEIAQIVLFLASPASNWLKGIDIPVDGGMGAMATADKLG